MAEDMRTVRLGVDKKYLDMINSVLGQLSDGYWENTPRMRGYWLFADAKAQGNECVLEIDPTRWGTRRGYSNVTNQWLDMSDAKVKQFLADKIKFLVKEEGLDWNRGNENTTDYLSYTQPYFKVKDCYYVYELLKGRNVGKHPEYSEAFYAKKNGKEFQIEIELVDGPNAEDPDKITVIVGDKSATVDVPKDGTEDHYRKAVAAGLKKLGYEMGEGKPANEAKTNESLGAVTRNSDRYKESFMLDCGTPENAIALADAITEEAYRHPAGSKMDDAGKHFLGGELIQCWPVGRFFTASVDPCDKAIEWCQNFLKNLGGSAPGLTGNDAGLN